MSNKQDIQEFWNSRAHLELKAGTKDINAKTMEMEAISKYISDGMKILDVGCGNGISAITIAKRYAVQIKAFDYAEKMIESAKKSLAGKNLKGEIQFFVDGVKGLNNISDKFDLVYTERVLINLPSWDEQKVAIQNILNLLKQNGLYIMCENSYDALQRLNSLRLQVGLQEIDPPWHNRYICENEVENLHLEGAILEKVEKFSSTYYFISRVINAWMAKEEGKEPAYDSPLNKLALKLPPMGDVGQTKIWVWRKL